MRTSKVVGAAFISLASLLLIILSFGELTPYIVLVAGVGFIASASIVVEPLKNSLGWVIPLSIVLHGITYGLLLILAPVWETQLISIAVIVMIVVSSVLISE